MFRSLAWLGPVIPKSGFQAAARCRAPWGGAASASAYVAGQAAYHPRPGESARADELPADVRGMLEPAARGHAKPLPGRASAQSFDSAVLPDRKPPGASRACDWPHMLDPSSPQQWPQPAPLPSQAGQQQHQHQRPQQGARFAHARQSEGDDKGPNSRPRQSNDSDLAGQVLEVCGGASVVISEVSETQRASPFGGSSYVSSEARRSPAIPFSFDNTAESYSEYADTVTASTLTLADRIRGSFRTLACDHGDGDAPPHHLQNQQPFGRAQLPTSAVGPPAASAAAPVHADATVQFRGLRVRMGMWTGVGSAAEVNVNARNGRTQYSGDSIRYAKAVADTAHGGVISLTEASRIRLDGKDVRSGKYVLLYGGLHIVAVAGGGGVTDESPRLHLYTVYSRPLLPRAVLVRPLRTEHELRPGALAAPVGHGAVAQMRVVGAAVLLAWNVIVTEIALRKLHAAATALLSNPEGPVSRSEDSDTGYGDGGSGGGYVVAGHVSLLPPPLNDAAGGTVAGAAPGVLSVVFPDADGAVSWAAAVRRAALELDWPPELLEHEMAEEVWAITPDNAGFGNGFHHSSGGSEPSLPRPSGLGRTGPGPSAAIPPRQASGRLQAFRSFVASRRTRFGIANSGAPPGAGKEEGQLPSPRAGGGARRASGVSGEGSFRASSFPSLEPQASCRELRALRPEDRSGTHLPVASSGSVTDGKHGTAGVRATAAAAADTASACPAVDATEPSALAVLDMTVEAGPGLASPPTPPQSGTLSCGRATAGVAPQAAAEGQPAGGSSKVSHAPSPVAASLEAAFEGQARANSAGTPQWPFPVPRIKSTTALPPALVQPSAVSHSKRRLPRRAPSDFLKPSRFDTANSSSHRSEVGPYEDLRDLPASELRGASGRSGNAGGAAASRRKLALHGGLEFPEPSDSDLALRLLFRGLRLRWGVACGPLKGGLTAGDASGQVSYRGKAAVAAAKLAAKAKAGQICATADLARALPMTLVSEITVIEKP